MLRRPRRTNHNASDNNTVNSASLRRPPESPTTVTALPLHTNHYSANNNNTRRITRRNNHKTAFSGRDQWSKRRRRRRKHRFPSWHILWRVAFTVVAGFIVLIVSRSSLQRQTSSSNLSLGKDDSNSFVSKVRNIQEKELFHVPSHVIFPTVRSFRKVTTTYQQHLPPALSGANRQDAKSRDFGNIDIDFSGQRRQIREEEESPEQDEDVLTANDFDNYYAMDDDAARNPYLDYDDDHVVQTKVCRRTSWHRRLPIDCNRLHEVDFESRVREGDTKFVGAGAYRQVHTLKVNGEFLAMKEYTWARDYDFRDFEFMRMDAMVSEIFQGNSRVVDIYGFCGLSMLVEGMSNGDMESVVEPRRNGEDGWEIPRDSSDPFMAISPAQKLSWSLQMAEALADLHFYKGGVIVHDDVHLGQFLLTDDGNLKLHDFNRAEPMLYNDVDGEYCKYKNNPGNGAWRAPEEYLDHLLDEKIDVFSVGVNMYALLTGLSPFADEEEISAVQERWMDGEVPELEEYAKSFAEKKLVEAIYRCWEYDPKERIDMSSLVLLLRKAMEESRARDAFRKVASL